MNWRRSCKHSDPCCVSCAKNRATAASWRARNLEKVKRYRSNPMAWEYTKKWRSRNPGRSSAAQKKFRSKPESREKARLAAAKWRSDNKDRSRASEMAWKRKNPGKVKAMAVKHNYRRRSLARGLFVEDVDVLEIAKAQCGVCYLCSNDMGSDITLDHIVPLTMGGPHSELNSAACHKGCNSSKNNRSLLQFFLRRRAAEVGA